MFWEYQSLSKISKLTRNNKIYFCLLSSIFVSSCYLISKKNIKNNDNIINNYPIIRK